MSVHETKVDIINRNCGCGFQEHFGKEDLN